MGYWCAGATRHGAHLAALESADVEAVAVERRSATHSRPALAIGRAQVGAAGVLDRDALARPARLSARHAIRRAPGSVPEVTVNRLGIGSDAAHTAEVGGRARRRSSGVRGGSL